MKFIDLFAGCGGLSLGLLKAGYTGIFAIEKSTDAFATLSYNLCSTHSEYSFQWPNWLPLQAMTTKELIDGHQSQLKKLHGEIDLIAGGPPCQGFSLVGLRNPDDPRNKLTEEYIQIVNIVRPKYIFLENVRGFQTAFKGNNKPYSLKVKEALESLEWGGYFVSSQMLEASLFGVPQPRPRFIMLAVRKDLGRFSADPFEAILNFLPSYREKKGLNKHKTTVKEALSDLEIKRHTLIDSIDTKGFKQIAYIATKLTPYQKLMREGCHPTQAPNSLRLPNHNDDTRRKFKIILETCPKGKSISEATKARFNMKKQVFTPLDPAKPARTVTTLPDDMLHYSEPRILTVRENARLQSFPDWFEFKGKYTTGGGRRKHECPRYTQVGNAVPPLMAEAIALAIKELVSNNAET